MKNGHFQLIRMAQSISQKKRINIWTLDSPGRDMRYPSIESPYLTACEWQGNEKACSGYNYDVLEGYLEIHVQLSKDFKTINVKF